MVTALTPKPRACPGGDEPCSFTTTDPTRGADSPMGRHIQSTHPRRYRTGGCGTCDYDPTHQRAMPPHDATYRCESGWYTHCSCDSCF